MTGQVDPPKEKRIKRIKGNQIVYTGKVACAEKVSELKGKH